MGGNFLKKGSPQNPLPKTSNVNEVGAGVNGLIRPKMLRDFGLGGKDKVRCQSARTALRR
jgi:hypothetical protein